MSRFDSADDFTSRLERDAHQVEGKRQAADDACSEPKRSVRRSFSEGGFECADCGADRVFGRRCDCGSYKLREIRQ